MKIDRSLLQTYVEKHLLSMRKHPDEELYIYDYTPKCQYDKVWDEITTMCRGLIVDGDGNVVARPFSKFFNRGEFHPEHTGVFTAHDKMDGSLGILYPHAGGKKLSIATRGSFVSEQALEATKMLQKYLDNRDLKLMLLEAAKQRTYLFEIIYPENRIVVDYSSRRDLVLLAIRDIETGAVIPARSPYFDFAKIIDNHETPRDNAEGVVLYYSDGFMEKVKYEDYVRLHRIVTGVTARSIWDLLRNGTGTKEIVDRVPEEFALWVKETTKGLQAKFEYIMAESKQNYKDIIGSFSVKAPIDPSWLQVRDNRIDWHEFDMISRAVKKQLNIEFNDCEYPEVIHAIHNHVKGEDLALMIWDMIKPKADRPYREDL